MRGLVADFKDAVSTLPETVTMNLGGETQVVRIDGVEAIKAVEGGMRNLVASSIVKEMTQFERDQQSDGPGSYASKNPVPLGSNVG